MYVVRLIGSLSAPAPTGARCPDELRPAARAGRRRQQRTPMVPGVRAIIARAARHSMIERYRWSRRSGDTAGGRHSHRRGSKSRGRRPTTWLSDLQEASNVRLFHRAALAAALMLLSATPISALAGVRLGAFANEPGGISALETELGIHLSLDHTYEPRTYSPWRRPAAPDLAA